MNIPVGEVFTSPVLKGTDGKLHVTKVYLNGLKYLDLEIDFQDGRISDYACANFDDPEENRKFIEENVLFHHDTPSHGRICHRNQYHGLGVRVKIRDCGQAAHPHRGEYGASLRRGRYLLQP